MTSTLQNMRHTIRTAFGDSELSYGGEAWILPLQGFYQGNGAGLAIWLIVSSNLLNIMRTLHFGAYYKAAISGEVL
jgi:hypothetical protein